MTEKQKKPAGHNSNSKIDHKLTKEDLNESSAQQSRCLLERNELGAGLPCLYRAISNEMRSEVTTSNTQPKEIPLSNDRKKSAFILAESVEKMAKDFDLVTLGFLTLTFKDHILDPKEAQRRLNCLITGVIKKRYRSYLGVHERQKSGRIHYHLLVALHHDIKTGVDFFAFDRRDYRSASKYLRSEWAFWRRTAPRYRFGRTELMPIRSNSQAIKFYVGKYISKTIFADTDNIDKGVRLVRYSRNARAGTKRFSFLTDGSKKWRQAVKFFSLIVGDHYNVYVENLDVLTHLLGSKWAYKYRFFISFISQVLEVFPDEDEDHRFLFLRNNLNFAHFKLTGTVIAKP